MTDKEKYDFIDHVVHLTLFEEDRLLNEHGGDYDGLEEDGIDSNEYYRIITERVINTLKKNNNYMQEEPVSEDLSKAAIDAADNGMQGRQIMEASHDDRMLYSRIFRRGFKAGAEWQKAKDQETIELAEDHAMLAGMEKMEQQMLSKAVDASCTIECNGNGTVCTKKIPLNGLRCGDTCKVIILKDE